MKIKKFQVRYNAKSITKYTGGENRISAFFISSAPRPNLVCSLIYRGASSFLNYMKDSYYFSHDSNARNDPKIAALIQQFGMEGYGLWWGLIEIMHEQGGKFQKFPKFYEGLSKVLSFNEAERSTVEATLRLLLPACINDFCLLKEDENYIWSDRVMRNIEGMKLKRLQKIEAGRLGGIKSGISRIKTKQNEATLEANEANEAKESKVKESKVKESKVKEIKDISSKPAKVSSPTTALQQTFYTLYQEKLKESYVPNWGKDGAIFEELLETHSLEQIKEKMARFFQSEDEFIKEAGYTTGVFRSQINKLNKPQVVREY